MGQRNFLPASAGKDRQNKLVISGTTKGNVGCAILEKHMALKRKLLFAAVIYARTEFRVLETFHCKLPKQKFVGQGDVNKLNRLASKEKIKLVVLPENYTAAQLEEARKACKE